MKSDAWLKQATAELETAGIATARLDALVLLEDVAGQDRGWLLAHPEHELSSAEHTKLTKLLKRRASHTPLAYVRGHTEFYGRNFVITPAVLEPRPESEAMIGLLKQLAAEGRLGTERLSEAAESTEKQPAAVRIADVGAGSGALGITAQLELSDRLKTTVDLLEIDPKVLKITKINVDKLATTLRVIKSDLLAETSQNYAVLLCNLPYVPDSHTVNKAALHEPTLAIFGGQDGLDVYRRLFEQIKKRSDQPLYILTESLPPQHQALAEIARAAGYHLERTDDFIQLFAHQSAT